MATLGLPTLADVSEWKAGDNVPPDMLPPLEATAAGSRTVSACTLVAVLCGVARHSTDGFPPRLLVWEARAWGPGQSPGTLLVSYASLLGKHSVDADMVLLPPLPSGLWLGDNITIESEVPEEETFSTASEEDTHTQPGGAKRPESKKRSRVSGLFSTEDTAAFIESLTAVPKEDDPTPKLEVLTAGNLRKVCGALQLHIKSGQTKPQLIQKLVKEHKRGLKRPEVFAAPIASFALKIGTLLRVLFSTGLCSFLVLCPALLIVSAHFLYHSPS
jgi:hypothetical protein